MNLLDAVILVAIVAAAIGGYRLGFLARSLSWIGLALAVFVAIRFVPDLMTALAGASPRGRLFAVLAFVFGLGLLGQALGLAVGTLVQQHIPGGEVLHRGDQAGGATVGVFGVLVLVWLLVPALTSAPGWPAREARGSTIVSTIDDVAPEPPASLRELGRMVAEAPYPEVFGPDGGPRPPGEVPTTFLAPEVDARVRASVVRVEGQACDQIQKGSGFVAAPGIVVTNAHVVAGERDTTVLDAEGGDHRATVVRFDPRRDLAVLRVPGLDAPPLAHGDTDVGALAVVYGYSRGGPLSLSPARIAERIVARGSDIYRTSETRRDVFVLAADLEPGDSGSALVDEQGTVVGVAFAIDPAFAGTAYALTDAELSAVLASVARDSVDTGYCLIG